MSTETYAQLVGLSTGVLLLSAVLLVWRRSLRAQVALLAAQGVGLAGLVLVLGLHEASAELVAVAVLVLVLKSVLLPGILVRTISGHPASGHPASGHGVDVREETPMINTTAALIALSLLTMLAFLVSRPLQVLGEGPTNAAVPVGIALVLYGMVVLATRRHAVSQLLGFLMLDNGIATVAFLTAGGVPLVVELGVSLDVLLVVLILQVLTSHIRTEFGEADLDDLTELRD
jgi:hydrogenase-4 component E